MRSQSSLRHRELMLNLNLNLLHTLQPLLKYMYSLVYSSIFECGVRNYKTHISIQKRGPSCLYDGNSNAGQILLCYHIYNWLNLGDKCEIMRILVGIKRPLGEGWGSIGGGVLQWFTETEMSSFWWNFHHWLHWKLSKWQLPVQPVMKISSKWRHFRFSVNPKLKLPVAKLSSIINGGLADFAWTLSPCHIHDMN